jgi:hypothetical protein
VLWKSSLLPDQEHRVSLRSTRSRRPRCEARKSCTPRFRDATSGYRFYNASTGRWPSRDPIEEIGGLNLYGLVRNGPPLHIDRDGRVSVSYINSPNVGGQALWIGLGFRFDFEDFARFGNSFVVDMHKQKSWRVTPCVGGGSQTSGSWSSYFTYPLQRGEGGNDVIGPPLATPLFTDGKRGLAVQPINTIAGAWLYFMHSETLEDVLKGIEDDRLRAMARYNRCGYRLELNVSLTYRIRAGTTSSSSEWKSNHDPSAELEGYLDRQMDYPENFHAGWLRSPPSSWDGGFAGQGQVNIRIIRECDGRVTVSSDHNGTAIEPGPNRVGR